MKRGNGIVPLTIETKIIVPNKLRPWILGKNMGWIQMFTPDSSQARKYVIFVGTVNILNGVYQIHYTLFLLPEAAIRS